MFTGMCEDKSMNTRTNLQACVKTWACVRAWACAQPCVWERVWKRVKNYACRTPARVPQALLIVGSIVLGLVFTWLWPCIVLALYIIGLCHYGRMPQDAAAAKKAEEHAAPAAAGKKVSVCARARTSYGWTEGPTSRWHVVVQSVEQRIGAYRVWVCAYVRENSGHVVWRARVRMRACVRAFVHCEEAARAGGGAPCVETDRAR